MKTTTINHFPPSQLGQFLIEHRNQGQPVRRELCDGRPSAPAHGSSGTTVWAGRHGGWIKLS